MRFRDTMKFGWVVLLALAGVLGDAYAQDRRGSSQRSRILVSGIDLAEQDSKRGIDAVQHRADSSLPLGASEDAAADMEGAGHPSPQQMAIEGRAHINQMEVERKEVEKTLSKAREERDVVKVLCLEDKLAQMESAQSAAGERWATLTEAVGANDIEYAVHAYTILVILKDWVSQLAEEAKQCIGVEAGFAGDSLIRLETPILPDPEGAIDPAPPDPSVPMPPVSAVL